MLLGLVMLPFRHCEAWIRRDQDGWLIGGRSHRGAVVLRRELSTLAHVWNGSVAPSPAPVAVGVEPS